MSQYCFEKPPRDEAQLIERCQSIAGLSFAQLARELGLVIPENPLQRKGWLGQVLEQILGATAGHKALPDFHQLGIELKTLPIGSLGKPAESTFITSIPLLTIHKEQWLLSQCYSKLKRILWLPAEDTPSIPFQNRRIGLGFLWSPSPEQARILEADWNYLTTMIITGKLEEVDAKQGEYLQIRPKAANGKSLCYAYDAKGSKVQTLPRGFYLRSRFTAEILNQKHSNL